MLNDTDIQHLRETFEHIDKDRTGMISPKELEDALNSETKRATGKQINSIFKNVDYRGNGKINYSEFLAATVSVKQVLT